jgi:hypothetical protein
MVRVKTMSNRHYITDQDRSQFVQRLNLLSSVVTAYTGRFPRMRENTRIRMNPVMLAGGWLLMWLMLLRYTPICLKFVLDAPGDMLNCSYLRSFLMPSVQLLSQRATCPINQSIDQSMFIYCIIASSKRRAALILNDHGNERCNESK